MVLGDRSALCTVGPAPTFAYILGPRAPTSPPSGAPPVAAYVPILHSQAWLFDRRVDLVFDKGIRQEEDRQEEGRQEEGDQEKGDQEKGD